VKVVLPLALPGLAAAAIFTFVRSWNEVFAAVILTLRQRTLPALVLAALNPSPCRSASRRPGSCWRRRWW
jgi:multiple sugar transport system permease protein